MTSNSRKPKSKITFKIGSILTFCGVLTIFILLIFAKDEILTYNFVFLMFLIITVISLSIVVLGTVIGYDNESVYNLGKLMLIYGLFLIAFFAIFNFFEIISFELFILLSSLLIGVVFLLLIIGMALSKEKGKILVQV